jgi:hypothetical protein
MRARLVAATLWSAPAERSGDGALAHPARSPNAKPVSRFACHRTPHLRTINVSVAVARCTQSMQTGVVGQNHDLVLGLQSDFEQHVCHGFSPENRCLG